MGGCPGCWGGVRSPATGARWEWCNGMRPGRNPVAPMAVANPRAAPTGLIARYACGELFNPADRTIAGLQPAHFISLASPFCGCDTDGVSAVPFIRWASDAPLLGRTLARLFEGVAHATAAALLSRTGEQFFLVDGAGGEDPLLLQVGSLLCREGQKGGDATCPSCDATNPSAAQQCPTNHPSLDDAGRPRARSALPLSAGRLQDADRLCKHRW